MPGKNGENISIFGDVGGPFFFLTMNCENEISPVHLLWNRQFRGRDTIYLFIFKFMKIHQIMLHIIFFLCRKKLVSNVVFGCRLGIEMYLHMYFFFILTISIIYIYYTRILCFALMWSIFVVVKIVFLW